MTRSHIECGPVDAGHTAASFFHNQGTCSDVPRIESLLPEPLQASGGHVAQVESCGPKPADGTRALEKGTEQVDEIAQLFLDVVGKTGYEQCVEQLAPSRDAYRRAVEESTLAALGGEQFSASRVVDYADLHSAIDLERQ
jgi:hypothetical protein